MELLAKTASGLSTSGNVADRLTMNLSDSIVNYKYIQVILYTSLDSAERQLSTIVVQPLYDGGDVMLALYSDSNTSYYCYTMFKLSGSTMIIRRAYFSNYSSPSFRVIGIP